MGEDVPRMMALGTREQPVSASRLEMWARCPYQYFLARSLGLEGLPEAESEEISALDRGSLVHRILERFVGAPARDLETLLAVAVDEFAAAEQQALPATTCFGKYRRRPSATGWRGCSPPKRNGWAMSVRWRWMPR